jgi:hypothetical protein
MARTASARTTSSDDPSAVTKRAERPAVDAAQEHHAEVARVLAAEAVIGGLHCAQTLHAVHPRWRRAQVVHEERVAFHAHLVEHVLDAGEVQVDGGGAAADLGAELARRNAVDAVREAEPARGVDDALAQRCSRSRTGGDGRRGTGGGRRGEPNGAGG